MTALLGRICSLFLCLSLGEARPASLPAVEPSGRAEVASLLNDARRAETSAEAVALLQSAEAQLEAERADISPVPWKYLEGDLARTRGSVAYQQSRERGGDPALMEQARGHFRAALEAYEALDALCLEAMDAIEKERGRRNITRHHGWNEAQQYHLRGQFASGWVHYQLGLCHESDVDRKLHFTQGIEAFADFVGSGYFRNPVVVESYLGTSLCLLELKRYPEVIELLDEASRAETPGDLYAPIVLARIKAWDALKEYPRVLEAAREILGRTSLQGSLSATELQILIYEAQALARTLKLVSDEKERKQHRERCIELTQELYGRGDPVRSELLRTLGRNELDTPVGRLADAHALRAGGEMEAALEAAWRGLKLTEVVEAPQRQRALHADFLQLLVAMHWEAGRWREVHELACAFIRQYADDLRAADVCLRGIHAGLTAMEADPPLPEEDFFECLAVAREQFPDLPEAQKGRWYRAVRLIGDERYARAVEVLDEVPPQSPGWREAQYGLAYASVQLAQRPANSQPAGGSDPHLQRAREAIARYVDETVKRPPPAGDELSVEVIQVAVVLARQLLDQSPPQAQAALEVLDAIDALTEMENEALDARLALRIESLMAAGQMDTAARYVDETLRKLASGERVIRAVTAATSPLESQLERHVADREPERRRDVARQLVRLYRHLLDAVDDSDSRADERERVLRHRLANALRQAGEYEQAVTHYEWLIERVEPSQAGNVCRGLALAYEGMRQHTEAIPLWRRLAKGLPRHSEGWHEARYHLIRSYHASGNREHARKLLEYYRLQTPDIQDAYWREQFEKLDRQLR